MHLRKFTTALQSVQNWEMIGWYFSRYWSRKLDGRHNT